MQNFLLLFMATAFVMSTAGCTGAPTLTPEQLTGADYGVYPTDYQDVIKRYMNDFLIDPYSARYEFLKGPTRAWHDDFGDIRFGYAVCAGINAKNRFGGYVGMKPFFFMLHNGVVVRHLEGPEIGNGWRGNEELLRDRLGRCSWHGATPPRPTP